jgi:hypothetical protein
MEDRSEGPDQFCVRGIASLPREALFAEAPCLV